MMQFVQCKGSPYELGLQHGEQAAARIRGSIAFYSEFFAEESKLRWEQCQYTAEKWLPFLEQEWVSLVEEMKGIADGAHVPFSSILALNVRTELAFGLSSLPSTTDGCTALSYHSPTGTAFLAQNWDWNTVQSANLIHLHLAPSSGPHISMLTEAGLIGKIGLNEAGVGVCLNALRARGVDYQKLPVHLALRVALSCKSSREAYNIFERVGVASAAHILCADELEAIGIESTSADIGAVVPADSGHGKVVAHTNHYLVCKPEGENPLKDSKGRLQRAWDLVGGWSEQVRTEEMQGILSDEKGWPVSINRKAQGDEKLETLFSIVMDLKQKRGVVWIGRPTEHGEIIVLKP